MPSDLIDSTQCAALLHCTPGKVEELAQAGELPALQILSAWLFVRADLLVFLAQKARADALDRRQRPHAKPAAPVPVRGPETPTSITAVAKPAIPAVHLVPAREAARLLSMGQSTFWREVAKKRLPQPVKIGGMTRWRVADLQRCVDSLDNEPTLHGTPTRSAH